ncbi:MAG TPA: glycosyltransferase [Gemmatimonadales bacterium]|nr:glycosyltransferase [Gemmatimonadales bacterium]
MRDAERDEPREPQPQDVVISVIVPCRGHARALDACLASVARQRVDVPFETLVVDSADDESVAAAARAADGVRLVRRESVRGAEPPLDPAAARNLGAARARGGVLAFIDADCAAQPGWLAAGLAALSGGARIAGGPVLDLLPWHPVAASDNLLQFADFAPARPDGPARYFPGCNLMIRTADFAALGGFPAPAVGMGEDVLLTGLALVRWPGGLRFVRAAQVRHEGRRQLGAMLRHQAGFGYARGLLGLHLSPLQLRAGAYAAAIPAVMLKRLGYILGRTARWHPARLPRLLLFFPVVAAGLAAWAVGFRRGLRARAAAGAKEPALPAAPSGTAA